MKTQYKISYFTINGLKDSFYEFHKSEPKSDPQLYIQGGYMKDVTKITVEATGFTTDNIEAARHSMVVTALNLVSAQAEATKCTQSDLDALGVSDLKSMGVHYAIAAPDGIMVATVIGDYHEPMSTSRYY